MSQKRILYPGSLGRHTPKRLSLAAAVRALKDKRAWEQWHKELETKLLVDLLAYYRIKLAAPDCWLALALRLARDHVPAFTISDKAGPGRPRKSIPISKLMRLGQPGAPKTWTDQIYKNLLLTLRNIAIENGYRGHGAATKAMIRFIRDGARRMNLPPERELRQELPYMRKRYSEAKKKFPDIAVK